jgi:hypothetical protein
LHISKKARNLPIEILLNFCPKFATADMFRALVVAVLLALANGCRSSDYNARVFHPWGCDDARDFKARLDGYKNVFVVCIYEGHWEDRGPNKYCLQHSKGTVVRVYKGDWRISERIAFVEGFDSPVPTNPRSAAGGLVFVFTNQHTETEIGLGILEISSYDAEYLPALESIFPQKAGR